MGIDETPVRPAGVSRDIAIILSLTREIKGDQESFKTDVTKALRGIDNAIIQQSGELKNQSKEIGRLNTNVADLSVRTSKLELETQKHEIRIQKIEEQRDDEITGVRNLQRDFTDLVRNSSQEQIADLKAEVTRLRSRHSKTPPHGSPRPCVTWWSTTAGKSVLAALAGLLMSVSSTITYFVAQSKPELPAKLEKITPVDPPVHKLPARYERVLLDDLEKSREGEGETDATVPR